MLVPLMNIKTLLLQQYNHSYYWCIHGEECINITTPFISSSVRHANELWFSSNFPRLFVCLFVCLFVFSCIRFIRIVPKVNIIEKFSFSNFKMDLKMRTFLLYFLDCVGYQQYYKPTNCPTFGGTVPLFELTKVKKTVPLSWKFSDG